MNRLTFVKSRQILRFLTTGGTVALLDSSLAWALSHAVTATLAVTMSFVVSAVCHYWLNRRWVFGYRGQDNFSSTARYLVTLSVSGLVGLVIFHIANTGLGFGVFIARLASIPPTTVITYALLRGFVFRPLTQGVKEVRLSRQSKTSPTYSNARFLPS